MSTIIEHLSGPWLVGFAMEALFDYLASHRGVYVLDLSRLSPELNFAVRENLEKKAGEGGVYRVNINGADQRFSIQPGSNGMSYELRRLSQNGSEESLAYR